MSIYRDLNKYKPRKEQQEAIEFIKTQWENNKMNKFFLLNLPTGVGKSYLAMMIVEFYKNNINKSARFDIITATKILQDQYCQTFESPNDLRGKENYECKEYNCSCAHGDEFNRLNKTKCEACPYSTARDSYINGNVSLTNFHLYILYALYNSKIQEARGSKVLIIDESHDFEETMSNFITIKVTETIVKKYKFAYELEILQKLKKIKTIDEYVEFLKYFNNEVLSTLAQMENSLTSGGRDSLNDKRSNKLSTVLKTKTNDSKLMQMITDLKQYVSKIEVFLLEYKDNPDNWILETKYNDKTKTPELSLEPIWTYDYLDKYVFSKYDMVFLMSGTILDKNMFCTLNGLDVNRAVYYSIDSPFDIKNRPIYYMPVGKMSYANKQETFKKYITYIKKLLLKYEGKKGIIHTNSFELANWIKDSIQDPRLIFHDTTNKDEVLKHHFDSDIPTVIVSPSVDTGVSFDDDSARFQIIAKMPYPSLASKRNKIRKSNNPDWYSYVTCGKLQQAYGRPVRSVSDYADTIILDGSFGDILKYSSNYLPDWFQSAIKRINVK